MRPDMTVSIDNDDICKLLRAIDAQTKAITKLTEDMPDSKWNEDTIGNIVAETETKNDR